MTFLEKLQTRKGGLIRLKTELFWYGGPARDRGWDGNPGRVCLLLGAAAFAHGATVLHGTTVLQAHTVTTATAVAATAYLLIDGSPRWVWVAEEDVELL